MAIDTLAYCKALEAAGVDRRAAEAQAEALINHVLPDLVTKADLLATTTVVAVVVLWLASRRAIPPRAKRALDALLAIAAVQFALGISTLLLVVPIPLAAAHQAGAVALLTAAIVLRHALRHHT